MLCVDGGSGLLAALPTAFPAIPVQRCWAHKIRNVLNKVGTADQAAIKVDLHRIMNATNLPAAWSAARRFADSRDHSFGSFDASIRATAVAEKQRGAPRITSSGPQGLVARTHGEHDGCCGTGI